MKYIITRTSRYDESPHPNATKEILSKVRDIRTFKSKEEWLKKFPKADVEAIEWGVTSDGSPFRVVVRERIIYIIDIPDLVEFVKINGRVILDISNDLVGYENYPTIEIYDDYRE